MRAVFSAYAAAAAVMAVLDLFWLGVIAKDLYRRELGHLMAPEVRWGAAVLFYLVYAAGIVYFAVRPGWAEDSLRRAALDGALLGLLVYAVYDLTSLALLRGWPVALSGLDILWGGFATCVAACAAFAASRV